MGDGTEVRIELRLNTDAIKEDATLEQWWGILRLRDRVIDPDWNIVYNEIAAIIIGSEVYRLFCKTAYEDNDRFARYLRGRVNSVKAEDEKPPAPVTKLVPKVVPTTPPPRPKKS